VAVSTTTGKVSPRKKEVEDRQTDRDVRQNWGAVGGGLGGGESREERELHRTQGGDEGEKRR
jgi:hypothetical protein